MGFKMSSRLLGIPLAMLSRISGRVRRYFVNSARFGLPIFVQVEITTRCNLRCVHCERNKDSARITNADMRLDLFKSIVGQLRYPTQGINLVGLGEPLLNPDVFSMIEFAKKKGFEVSLIDNFTLMNREKSRALIKSGLDYLYVSFDSVSKNVFEELRTGACFEIVVDNIKLFAETKKEANSEKPVFLFKSTISQKNFKEIPDLIKLAEDLGADGINFGKLMSRDKDSEDLCSMFLDEADLPKTKITVYPCELSRTYECDTLSGFYVSFDGKVLPCGLMAESASRAQYSQLQLGDLNVDKIAKIWRADNFRRLREKLKSGLYFEQCETCPANKWLKQAKA